MGLFRKYVSQTRKPEGSCHHHVTRMPEQAYADDDDTGQRQTLLCLHGEMNRTND